MPEVSVIMNCLNKEQHLKAAIDSVFAQTYRDWEIIFYDDASTDASYRIGTSYGNRVRAFREQTTRPLGYVRNRAIEKAKGKYLAFLDCDDVWHPEKLVKQLRLFEQNPAVGLVYSNVMVFNDNRDMYVSYRNREPVTGNVFRDILNGFVITMSTVVIRRSCLNQLGTWFDERFSMIEDHELYARLAERYEFDCVNEPLAKWRLHDSGWSQKRCDLFPEERAIMLGDLTRRIPDFEKQYAEESRGIRKRIKLERAKAAWRQGARARARELFKEAAIDDPQAGLFRLLAFLPYDAYAGMRSIAFKYFTEENAG